MMKKVLFLIILLFFIPIVISESTSTLYFKTREVANLNIPCIVDNLPCSSNSYCNITISYPNTTLMIQNEPMTYQTTYYTYTIPNTNVTGIYNAFMYCCDGTECGYSIFQYTINNGGDDLKPDGMIGMIILAPLLLGIIIMWGAVSLGPDHKVLKIFMFLLSFIGFIGSLYFGAINIVRFYNFPELQEGMSNYIFIFGIVWFVMLCYFIIYFFWKIFKDMNQSNEEAEY